jgi:hypothetical protein
MDKRKDSITQKILQSEEFRSLQRVDRILASNGTKGALFMSNYQFAKDINMLIHYDIRCVLSLTDDPPLEYPKGKGPLHKTVDLLEDPDVPVDTYFDDCVAWIEANRSKRRNVLITCYDGFGISPTIVGAYLINSIGMPVVDAYKLLRERNRFLIMEASSLQTLAYYETNLRKARAMIPELMSNRSPKSLHLPKLVNMSLDLNTPKTFDSPKKVKSTRFTNPFATEPDTAPLKFVGNFLMRSPSGVKTNGLNGMTNSLVKKPERLKSHA